ncbi:hypothetical protein A7981_02355 [Methylovorus sp. MM2]|uniref:spore coat protein U domain-containing protein n=1 Tax=Methylovorus sp. MM2 TaxID=1848038 RepID=UPI0007DECC69|nr:spore coat protein U domain-containing protein [Methylovorus sp. MM2]OAM52346.1 hypothetical protein A7981_02355 [Methylovorus sp. MM2]
MTSSLWLCRYPKSAIAAIAILMASYAPLAHAIAICSVTATGPVIIYDPSDSGDNITGVGSVTVSCLILVQVTPVTYQIQMGLSPGNANYTNRTMKFSGNNLNYNLYTNPARNIVWGNGSSGTSTRGDSIAGLLGVTAIPYDIYARIPAHQSVTAGVYTDTLNILIVY